jgi:hypothetical protein
VAQSDEQAFLLSYRPGIRWPEYRSLWVYILDPAQTGLRQTTEIMRVRYERLAPGPVGQHFMVDSAVNPELMAMLDKSTAPAALDLDEPTLVASFGVSPTTGNPLFAAQMVYAVSEKVFGTFSNALGRKPSFGPWLARAFENGTRKQLLLQPNHMLEDNAFYDPNDGSLKFGFFRAKKSDSVLVSKGSLQQYALSHDIICHELAHALLDGMRSHFIDDTHVDVAAFHEGFSDLIALLHHFTSTTLVQQAVEESGGVGVRALLDLGRQLGESDTARGGSAMRTAINAMMDEARIDGTLDEAWQETAQAPLNDELTHEYERLKGDEPSECHDRGAIFVMAVMEAFLVVFRKRARPFRRLAKIAKPNETASLPKELVELLTKEVTKLAEQFLRILIRAVDYCPPVDLRFGEFLRAMLTADRDLVPYDEYDYRGALVRAFRKRGIAIDNVLDLSTDSLYWGSPQNLPPPGKIQKLAFSRLRLADQGHTAIDEAEMRRWGQCLMDYVCENEATLNAFGLTTPDKSYGPVVLESLNLSYRRNHRNESVRGLIAEVTQTRQGARSDFVGGCTIVLDERGKIRYTISKRVTNVKRRIAQAKYRAALK